MKKTCLRKLFALSLAFALLFGLLPSAAAASSFQDIVSGSWYEGHMLKMVDAGVIAGDGKGNAMPDRIITRAEAAILLSKAFGLDTLTFEDVITGKFTDIAYTDTYVAQYINGIVAAGFMSGVGEDRFEMTRQITRGEALVIIRQALLLPDAPNDFTSAFSDYEGLPGWASEHILAMEYAGLFSGKNGVIAQGDNITRAEFAALLSNAVGVFIDTSADFENADMERATIRKPDVAVQNLTAESMLLTPGLGDGDADFEGCDIGILYVQGGGVSSVNLVNTAVTALIIEAENPVRVAIDEDSIVETAYIFTTDAVFASAGTVDSVLVYADNVAVDAPLAEVTVAADLTGVTVGGELIESGSTIMAGGDGKPVSQETPEDPEPPLYTAVVDFVNQSIIGDITTADENGLFIELSGTLEYEDNVFLETSAIDFEAVVTENARPIPAILGGAFTAVEINLKDILTALGYETINILQTNPALAAYAQGGGSTIDQPANIVETDGIWTKESTDRDISVFDDAFTVLVLGGETATLVITEGDGTFTVTIDATELTIGTFTE